MKTRTWIARTVFFVFLVTFLVAIAGYWLWNFKPSQILLIFIFLDFSAGIVAFLTRRENPFQRWDKVEALMMVACVFLGFVVLPIVALIEPKSSKS
jgi:zinc transporter ZupT